MVREEECSGMGNKIGS